MKKESPHILPSTLSMVAWEVTRRCNLACAHCRASALLGPYEGELDTAACMRLIDDMAAFSNPVVILTGGEPLLRADIFDIAAYGDQKGLRMVVATNGTIVTTDIAEKLLASGIKRVSMSIDGADAASHDAFRRVPGAFDGSMRGIKAIKEAGLEFQINTTITQANLRQIKAIHDMVLRLGAAAHHIFLLVPTGRGKEMADQAISPMAYEETLEWFYGQSESCSIQIKATCAPHYYRILRQKGSRGMPRQKEGGASTGHPLNIVSRGCLGGSSFCFISHVGQVQPCGYLEVDCGQIKKQGFKEIWQDSDVFRRLRDLSLYKGKCGRCEFIKVCGGCRARAFEATGDYLSEEPFCIYEPKKTI
ncbi:MAG: putative mycofactocin radical SAM maturase MftC [Syntrophus sp. SKADARSKE-3]|nr:putative mycofactocin radical SAM maturase MftC [Syntrophus sp. SKADARSKE-3]